MGVVEVHGTVADGYEPVRAAFEANFAERGDTGAAVAVHRDGRPVVDLWGGARHAEEAGSGDAEPWRAGTAVVVRSVTKGVAAAVPHLLHQRGQLDLDAPIGVYWPEFKAAGKERVRVRHLLAHRAGLPALDTPLTLAQAVDGVSGPRALAAQPPLWEPGTAHGYHAHTFSWLLDELVRRATGRRLGTWFAQEVARPLGLDLWIGLPERDADGAPLLGPGGRVGRVGEVPTPPPAASRGLRVRPKRSVLDAYRDPDSLTSRAFGAVTGGTAALLAAEQNDPHYLAAGLPGSAGVATARALSRFYAALIAPLPDGPGRGKRLFAPATLTQARSEESAGPDRVLVVNTRFGLGYMLHGPACPMLAPGSFGHPGRGGSLAFADPESGTAFAYVTNGMQRSVTSDPRAQSLVKALRSCG